MKQKAKTFFLDIGINLASAVIVAFGLHCFANPNNFAPGGVSGLAAMTGYLTNFNMAYFIVLFNLPIFILYIIFVNKRVGVMLILYVVFQAVALLVLELVKMPVYRTEYNLVIAALAAGVITGFGYALALKRFGASGGTYAISAIIKKFRPASNLAWVAFAMDASVVGIAFFVYGFKIEPVLCTLVNLFIANLVVDHVLKGIKSGYKIEIVTNIPNEIAQAIMEKLGRGVSCADITGMYTNEKKYTLTCIVRKRQMAEIFKILKNFPDHFTYISHVNEVVGKFA